MSRYWKAILATLGAIGTWGITAGADEVYSDVELWGLLAAVATAVAVYWKKNVNPDDKPYEPRQTDVSEAAG